MFKEGDRIVFKEDVPYNNKVMQQRVNRNKANKGSKGLILKVVNYSENVNRITIKNDKGFNLTVYTFEDYIELDKQYYREKRLKHILDEEG